MNGTKMFYAALALLVFSASACSASAAEVAMVVKDASSLSAAHEQRVKSILQGMGNNVTLVDKNSPNVNYSKYGLIVVAGRPKEEPSYNQLDQFVAGIPVNNTPTIAVDSMYVDDWGWGNGISSQFTSDPHEISIVDGNHTITQGYAGFVPAQTIAGKALICVDRARTNMSVLASPKQGTCGVVMASEANKSLSNGRSTNSKIVFFGIAYPLYWTSEAEDLFKKSVYWLMDDADGDGMNNTADNCPAVYNPLQADMDNDGIGDPCDADIDGDGITNAADNCAYMHNPSQNDSDHDGIGDPCDICQNDTTNDADSDGICGLGDNCPSVSNPVQSDSDMDGKGDACDTVDTRPDVSVESIAVPSNATECESLSLNVTLRNRGHLNASGYKITIEMGGSAFEARSVSDALHVNQTATLQFSPGDPFTCGNLTLRVRATISNVTPLGDINASNDFGESAVNFLPVHRADVDGDSIYETAMDTDGNQSNGFEAYQDPNNNTVANKTDLDMDGKADYLIDVNSDGRFEKYWDPDSGLLYAVLRYGDIYYVQTGANSIRSYCNGTASQARNISYDVSNDGINETLIDVNNNSRADSEDKVWLNGLYSLPDITVTAVSFSSSSPANGETITVTASVRNSGQYNASNFKVGFAWDNAPKENTSLSLSPGQTAQLAFTVNMGSGTHSANMTTDAGNAVMETDESNNYMQASVTASSAQPTPAITTASTASSGTSSTVTQFKEVTVSGFPGSVDVAPGESYTKRIQITNTGNQPISGLVPYLSGIGADFFSISPSSFDMTVGSSDEADITVTPAGGTADGLYSVRFELRIGSISYFTRVLTINVSGPAAGQTETQNISEGNQSGDALGLATQAGDQNQASVAAPITGMFAYLAESAYGIAALAAGAVAVALYGLSKKLKASPRSRKGRRASPWQDTIDRIVRSAKGKRRPGWKR